MEETKSDSTHGMAAPGVKGLGSRGGSWYITRTGTKRYGQGPSSAGPGSGKSKGSRRNPDAPKGEKPKKGGTSATGRKRHRKRMSEGQKKHPRKYSTVLGREVSPETGYLLSKGTKVSMTKSFRFPTQPKTTRAPAKKMSVSKAAIRKRVKAHVSESGLSPGGHKKAAEKYTARASKTVAGRKASLKQLAAAHRKAAKKTKKE